MIELRVLGLTLDATTNAPILVLKAEQGEDILPLWIGGLEAMSIALALGRSTPERPLAHDLTMRLLDGLDARVEGLSITDVRDGVFYGVLDIICGERFLQVDCRPSDGIALALRAGAVIRATPLVLARAPKERYRAAAAGKPPLPDETGAIIRRTLEKLGSLLEATLPDSASLSSPATSSSPNNIDAARPDLAESERKPLLPSPPDMPDFFAQPAAPADEEPFARLLRELEPASKHRM